MNCRSGTHVTADLSGFADQTIMIRFAFASDGSTSGMFGWQIDNIVVSNSTKTLFSNSGTNDGSEDHLFPHNKYAGDYWHVAEEGDGNHFAICNENNAYLAGMDNSLISKSILLDENTIPEGDAIKLDFKLRGTFTAGDVFSAYVLVDGNSENVSNINGCNETDWTWFSSSFGGGNPVDLSSYRGKTIQLVFKFNSDFNPPNGEGIQIDDIKIYSTTEEPPPPADERKLYISDANIGENIDRILKADLNGGSLIELSNTEDRPTSVFFNPDHGKMYWANSTVIKKADYEGQGAVDLVNGETNISEAQIDMNTYRLYWLSGNKIKRAEIQGFEPDNITIGETEEFITSTGSITGYTLDVGNNKIYFIEEGSPKVQVANLSDGLEEQDISSAGISGTNVGIDFDPYEQAIFYSNNAVGGSSIVKLQLPNYDPSTVASGLTYIQNFTCEERDRQLYVSLGTTIRKISYDFDENNGTDIITEGLNSVIGLNILDMTDDPLTQASNVQADIEGTEVNLSWNRGNEERCIVIMRAEHENPGPINRGVYYNAAYDGGGNSIFNEGTHLGNGWVCVYNGVGTSVTVIGLSPNRNYTTAVYEYNGRNGYENYSRDCDNNFVQFVTEPLPTVQVTFKVDMSIYVNAGLFNTGSDNVYLRGSFNGWGFPEPPTDEMAKEGESNIYTITKSLSQNTPYEYKYFINKPGDDIDVWEGHVGGEYDNRQLTTETSNMELDVVYFNNLTEPPLSENHRLYISNTTGITGSDQILMANLDGSAIQVLLTGEDRPTSIFFDKRFGKMNWANAAKIRIANDDGSNFDDLKDNEGNPVDAGNNPLDIKVNVCGDRLFWLNSTGIIYASSDGWQFPPTQFLAGNITGFTLDVGNNKIYYIDRGDNKLKSTDLDQPNPGSIQELASIAPGTARGIAFDPYQQTIFYSENGGGIVTIKKLQLGSEPELVCPLVLPAPDEYPANIDALCTDQVNNVIYFSNLGTDVYKVNYDGSGFAAVVTGLNTVTGISVFHRTLEPSTPASNITFSNIQTVQADINWTRGDGERCVVFMKNVECETHPCEDRPPVSHGAYYVDGENVFGSGTQTQWSGGWYCVYNGTGGGVTVTGLTPATTYGVAVYEYNGKNGFEVYNYNEGNYAEVTTDEPLSLTLIALIEGFYNGTAMVSDEMVTVQLRNSSTPDLIEDQTNVTLNTSGVGTAYFSSVSDGTPYYIVIKHRNSIETWSAQPQSFSGGTLNYDFTDSQSKAYGDNLKKIGESTWCIYSGDVNQDDYVDLFDDLEVYNDSYNGTYRLLTDLNLDNSVDLFDDLIVYNNSYNGVSAQYPGFSKSQNIFEKGDKKVQSPKNH